MKTVQQSNNDYVRVRDFNEFTRFVSKHVVTKNEFSSAMTGIDKKFTSIDQRFEKIDQRFEKVDQRFETLDKKIDRVHHDLMKGMDYIIKYVDEKRTEDAAQVYINKRHETWIKDLAKHTKYSLNNNA